jgi:2-polyprenyl-6-methoxyphenol hydroxylase-like FAD-dependent oxidoreductase
MFCQEPGDTQGQAAVIGGGISGLGITLPLLRVGLGAHVYEQAHALREVRQLLLGPATPHFKPKSGWRRPLLKKMRTP